MRYHDRDDVDKRCRELMGNQWTYIIEVKPTMDIIACRVMIKMHGRDMDAYMEED